MPAVSQFEDQGSRNGMKQQDSPINEPIDDNQIQETIQSRISSPRGYSITSAKAQNAFYQRKAVSRRKKVVDCSYFENLKVKIINLVHGFGDEDYMSVPRAKSEIY